VVAIGPERYNELYDRFGNLNELLGWGHARVIENLLSVRPECRRSLSDKFASERVIERALMKQGKTIQVDQRTKAESDIAVAAASILARERFVTWLEDQSKRLGIILPKGVSAPVKAAAQAVIDKHGAGALPSLAKMHFRTAQELMGGS
jgi:ribonuclease HIII